MRPPVAFLLALLLGASPATADPARRLNYAESADRLVYAFVSGHKDTCRVIRRPTPPPFPPDDPRARRLPDNWKGGTGETLLGEFEFGRRGRPVHIVLTNDGKWLVGFSNRPAAGAEAQDLVWSVATAEPRRVEYAGMPGFAEPAWPEFERALAKAKPLPADETPRSYAFVTKEVLPGRLLVARQSEDADGHLSEMTCFTVFVDKAEARPPERAELVKLLQDDEPLFRAAAARLLGLEGDRAVLGELKASLQRTEQDSARVELAAAMVRCGDRGARKTLRVLLPARPAAARALALLPPDAQDADELAVALEKLPDAPARHAAVALARLGERGARALAPTARSRTAATRVRVAEALGHVDDVGAERTLLRLVGDPDESVRKAAAKALTNPPRRIMESNYGEFAKALAAAGKTETRSAAYRLATLAMHADLNDDRILGALVELTTFHERASLALRKLTGLEIETSDDWKRWWKER